MLTEIPGSVYRYSEVEFFLKTRLKVELKRHHMIFEKK